ncbi:MAG: hypothetical protein ACFFDN_24660, partial [Candidatus Hodarchaeota archaeon]
MKRLNLDNLINTSIGNILLNLDVIFENLLQEINSYLNIDLIYSYIKIIYYEAKNSNDNLNEEFFKIGVKKTQKNNSLTIYLSSNYKKFLKIILLREAYKCFIPLELQENDVVNIFINQKVEIDLQNSEYIEDWKELKRKSIMSYDFMEAEFDRLEKFLKQEGGENQPSPFQFFFFYIRKNVDMIGGAKEEFISLEKKSFYDIIFEEYTRNYTEYPEEIRETIRIITAIFYKVKSYRSLLDYQHYFKEFKESGYIKTDLSLRKFTEHMQWIKKFSNIAPNYQINWPTLDVVSSICVMRFHPIIENNKIFKIIKYLPFFIYPSYSKSNFGLEIIGYFLFPKIYIRDLINILEKLESDGFLIEKHLYISNSVGYTFNLNSISSKSIILNPDKKDYNKEHELEFKMHYHQGSFKSNLSLFDWFLIDRIRYVSITGFGFERKSETLKSLKSDLLNEIESQRKLINEIKENLYKIHSSSDFKREFLDLIDQNQSFGFFYIKQMFNDYLTMFYSINKILTENPFLNNFFQFQEFIRKHRSLKSIEENILFTNLKKRILEKSVSLFINSKPKFNEMVQKYQYYYDIFKSFNDLKLFDLKSIKSIINDEYLVQKIFKSKEQKLKNSYESYKIYKLTNQIIEARLEDFLNNEPPVIQPSLINTIMIILRLIKFYPVLILKDNLQTRKRIEKIKWLVPRVVILETSEYKTQDKYICLRLLMPNLRLKEKQLLFSIFYNLFKENIVFCKSFFYSPHKELFSRKDFYDLEREEFFYSQDLFDQSYQYIRNVLNREIQCISKSPNNLIADLWGKNNNIPSLINKVENRISKENNDFNIKNLNELLDYHINLKSNLIDLDRFKHYKNEFFFKNYIKAIKIFPAFQSFGFGKYFLYFYPTNFQQIDIKHLLHNSFKKIKFPASVDSSNPFLIEFIWPYRNPNISLLNWLNKSKRVIREYCVFFIKRVFQIFHFNYNLSVNEWDLNPNRFKIYFQNVLFNPDYNLKI